MSRTTVACLIAACFLFAPTATRADIVKMKDGRSLEGKISQEDDNEIKLDLSRGGGLTIQKKDIAEIVRQRSTLEILDEKLRALNPRNPAAYMETGKWCLEQVKREDVGLRLVTTAMALDARLFSEGQLYLGDYFLNQKRDKGSAAACFVRALIADPANPTCLERFRQVKVSAQDLQKNEDRSLGAAIDALRKSDWPTAIDNLPAGGHSTVRPRVEELLAQKLEAVLTFCQSKIPCKLCKGTGFVQCSDCKGTGVRECKTCGATGYLTRMSSKGTTKVSCTDCSGAGKFLCKRCKATRGSGGPATSQFGTVIGGKLPCTMCKGKIVGTGIAPPNYSVSGLEQAKQFMDHRLSGLQNLSEQAEARMIRVGGQAQVDGADELIANPIWTGDRWGPVGEVADTAPNAPDTAPDHEAEVLAGIRKSAAQLGTDKSGVDAFRDQVRKSFGIDAISGTAAQQIYTTDFATQGLPGEQESAGPHVEFDPAASLARPALAQIGKPYATNRITLVTAGAAGVALPPTIDWARLGTAPGTVFRLYYTVVEGKEDVLPGAGRDVGLYQLTIKLILVELVDATGKITRSAR